MEERQRLEIGQRITALRERSPFTQPVVADKLGIGLRAYQQLEKVGTTRYERCEELADIHAEWTQRSEDWQHVSADWIWDGQVREKSPDLMNALSAQTSESALEAAVSDLTKQVAALKTELLAELSEVRSEQEAQRKLLGRGGRGSATSRK
jgi:transcriptional regulator with XRE-family HTH domain